MIKRKLKWAIVTPTIRGESINKFLRLWGKDFSSHKVIIVEDNPQKTFKLPDWTDHYSWYEIDKELGRYSWIIPRRSDTVRSFGFFKAWQEGVDFILTIDDDCYPEKKYEKDFLELMEDNLRRKWPDDSWWNTLDEHFPRGYPYKIRNLQNETVLHHGLWSNVPDLDAKTQKRYPEFRTKPASAVNLVPRGRYFPMCGMNVAFKRKIVPAMYFFLMGRDLNGNSYPFDRFGDIWAGVILKKIADHLGYAVSSGNPSVNHSRASNVEVNMKKERLSVPAHELFWRKIDRIVLTKETFAECYKEIADNLEMNGKYDEYWSKQKKAMKIWSSLFSG